MAAMLLVVGLLTQLVSLSHATVWEDAWDRVNPDVEAVTCRRTPECGPYVPMDCDPFTARYRTFPLKAGPCSLFPSPCLTTDPVAERLTFYGENRPGPGGEGFALVSRQTFDRMTYLSTEVSVRARCGPTLASGCFFGLTLYNGESNYRELAYVGHPDQAELEVWRFAGGACDPHKIHGPIAPMALHTLRLDYYGHQGGTWVYSVDHIVRHIESGPIGVLGRVFHADPRIALFFSGTNDGTFVAGDMGPLRVWSGVHRDTAQLALDTTAAVTEHVWLAQAITMGPQTTNLARIALSLEAGQVYHVAAYTDQAGVPGSLINAVAYTAIATGIQDVPLLVPKRWPKLWVLLRGMTAAPVAVGTTSVSMAGEPALLRSSDAGASWETTAQTLYYATYERR